MSTHRALSIQARIRRRLHNAPALTRALQTGRAVLHFGPWRHAAHAIIRWIRPPQAGNGVQTPTSLGLNTCQLARSLRDDGMAMANHLPPNVLSRVRTVTDELPPGEYGDFHEHPDFRALVQCADVLDVVRGYLGAEPELLECTLVVHHAEDPASRKLHPQRLFHSDYAGWKSLALFVYLTDVSEDSGAHQVVVGTHCTRNMWDAIRPWVPENEINARYAGRIRTITGPAGTMFFEDTEAFHRRLIIARRRAMAIILYASHRSWLSKDRPTPKYSDYLLSRGASDLDAECPHSY